MSNGKPYLDFDDADPYKFASSPNQLLMLNNVQLSSVTVSRVN